MLLALAKSTQKWKEQQIPYRTGLMFEAMYMFTLGNAKKE